MSNRLVHGSTRIILETNFKSLILENAMANKITPNSQQTSSVYIIPKTSKMFMLTSRKSNKLQIVKFQYKN